MSDEPLASARNPWFATSIAIVVALVLAASFAGFVVLPTLQSRAHFADLWDAICSAAGIPQAAPAEPIVPASYRTTQVVVIPRMLAHASAESIGRGATLALRCTMCHGARGMGQADSPNLAGQYPTVIYKQLRDFQSGARVSAVMQPLVAGLSDQDLRDLAAYYAYLPRVHHAATSGPVPRIVLSGAPMRNIAPCGACHGALDDKSGAAWLEGQPAAYLQGQLEAFASGARHNDISEQMRNVARNMYPAEISAAATYYSGQP